MYVRPQSSLLLKHTVTALHDTSFYGGLLGTYSTEQIFLNIPPDNCDYEKSSKFQPSS